MTIESEIEINLINHLKELKYNHRPDIVDRKTLEQNFSQFFVLSEKNFSSSICMEIMNRSFYFTACKYPVQYAEIALCNCLLLSS